MPVESDQWEQKYPLSHQLSGKYELKCIHFIRNNCHCMENLKTIDFYCDSVMTGTYILSKQNFLLLRPSWMSSWISQSLINYINLCWQFQILQTLPNILVYDTSCKKKRFDSLTFWLHWVSLKMALWERKMTKTLRIFSRISHGKLCRQFQKLQTMPNILVYDYDTSCSTRGGGGGRVRVTPRNSGLFSEGGRGVRVTPRNSGLFSS